MEIYGLFGEKLGHSLSPDIFKMLFDIFDIDGTFNLFEIKREDFKNSIISAKTLNVSGVNVTIPYKEDVINLIDDLDDSVKKIGACNLVTFKDKKAKGFNTDYYGFLDSLKRNDIIVNNKDVVMLGYGGAGKSILQALLDSGASSITIVSRRDINIYEEKVKVINYDSLNSVNNSYLLVNATSVGMYPDVDNSPVPKEFISKFEVCLDIVYNPVKTKLLKEAQCIGLKTVNGVYMLLSQAVYGFKIYTGLEVSEDDYLKIYNHLIKKLEIK